MIESGERAKDGPWSVIVSSDVRCQSRGNWLPNNAFTTSSFRRHLQKDPCPVSLLKGANWKGENPLAFLTEPLPADQRTDQKRRREWVFQRKKWPPETYSCKNMNGILVATYYKKRVGLWSPQWHFTTHIPQCFSQNSFLEKMWGFVRQSVSRAVTSWRKYD